MRRECRERFIARKPLVSDPNMLKARACATRNFTYLARGPWGLVFDSTLGQRQTIACTSVNVQLIGPMETKLCEMWIKLKSFWCEKIQLKRRHQNEHLFVCLGPNV